MLGGSSSSSGISWSPVPYSEEQVCDAVATDINEASADDGPYYRARCIPMPASDIIKFNHSIGRAANPYYR